MLLRRIRLSLDCEGNNNPFEPEDTIQPAVNTNLQAYGSMWRKSIHTHYLPHDIIHKECVLQFYSVRLHSQTQMLYQRYHHYKIRTCVMHSHQLLSLDTYFGLFWTNKRLSWKVTFPPDPEYWSLTGITGYSASIMLSGMWMIFLSLAETTFRQAKIEVCRWLFPWPPPQELSPPLLSLHSPQHAQSNTRPSRLSKLELLLSSPRRKQLSSRKESFPSKFSAWVAHLSLEMSKIDVITFFAVLSKDPILIVGWWREEGWLCLYCWDFSILETGRGETVRTSREKVAWCCWVGAVFSGSHQGYWSYFLHARSHWFLARRSFWY